MRLAHVTATYPPATSGTGNVARQNAVDMARRGHEVSLFTARVSARASARADDAPTDEILDGVRVHRLRPLLRAGNAFLLPQLVHALRGFDVIHLHLPFYGGAEAVLARRRTGDARLVITYHQDVLLAGVRGLISQGHDRLIGGSLLRLADRVCFTSLDYARASRVAPLLDGGAIRAVELPNAVDLARFTPGAAPATLERRYRPAGETILLFVGALDRAHYFKGIDVLLEAVRRLARENLSLVLVGDGDLRTAYRREAAALGLADRVRFAGRVPDADLPDYYRLADATILPSTTAGEAFGLVLLESLACGTPVVASALPGVRTLVSAGEDGLLAAPGDAADLAAKLAALLASPAEERRAMGLAGRRKVESRYAPARIGDRLEALYAEILPEGVAGARPPLEHGA